MKYVSDDGKEFMTEEACKAYEKNRETSLIEKTKLYDAIVALNDEINKLLSKRNSLITQYWEKYPTVASEDMRVIFCKDDDDDDDEDCCNCDNIDECIVEMASSLVYDFEKLQELIHTLD